MHFSKGFLRKNVQKMLRFFFPKKMSKMAIFADGGELAGRGGGDERRAEPGPVALHLRASTQSKALHGEFFTRRGLKGIRKRGEDKNSEVIETPAY